MKTIREIVSTNITNLRKQAKLTQVDLAKKVNFSDKAISRWEKGEVLPDIETLELLAKTFEVSVSYMIEEHTKKPTCKKPIQKPPVRDVLSQVLIICEIWTILGVVFAFFVVARDYYFWQLFIWGIPGTAIFLRLYYRKRKNSILNFIYETVFVWSILTCIFLHMISILPWYIFIIGVPIQGILIIKNFFNYKKNT